MHDKRMCHKREFLEKACLLDGVYVPEFYEPEYNDDGTLKNITKLYNKAPDRVRKALIKI